MKKITLAVFQIILLSIMLFACGGNRQQDYAIKDFRADLSPILKRIVDKGYIETDSITERLHIIATEEELTKLLKSEHPLLRATAILERLRRDSLADNHFLKQHLDDTALISKLTGRWGLRYTTVADIMLDNAEWASDSLKMKMIREVILHHNNLSAAFHVLRMIDAEPGLYSAIRVMTTRERDFDEREEAMFALAAYRKKEDVRLLQKILFQTRNISDVSFQLMQNYPDTSYLSVLEEFFMYRFIGKVCKDEPYFYSPTALDCLASYKEPRSAVILSKLWNMKIPEDCSRKWDQMKDFLIDAIWDNKCESYAQLLKTTAAAKKIRDQSTIEIDTSVMAEDITGPLRSKITWRR